ncbi:hypothetical protein ACLOJK_032755 [Asimina triloba]
MSRTRAGVISSPTRVPARVPVKDRSTWHLLVLLWKATQSILWLCTALDAKAPSKTVKISSYPPEYLKFSIRLKWQSGNILHLGDIFAEQRLETPLSLCHQPLQRVCYSRRIPFLTPRLLPNLPPLLIPSIAKLACAAAYSSLRHGRSAPLTHAPPPSLPGSRRLRDSAHRRGRRGRQRGRQRDEARARIGLGGGAAAEPEAAQRAGIVAAVVPIQVRAVHAVQGRARAHPPGAEHAARVLSRSLAVQMRRQALHALRSWPLSLSAIDGSCEVASSGGPNAVVDPDRWFVSELLRTK